ncbi:MAG: glycoside hydrolase family 32 protein [Bacteroidota bacterium]
MLLLRLLSLLTLTACLALHGPELMGQKTTTNELDKVMQSRKLRQRIMSDPHRPIYHFVAPEGMAYPFDPNGGIYWNGKYHLGFIYQAYHKGFREHYWGHAVSTDLLHWQLYPDMLDVKDGDIEKGIFSGGAFLSREGIPHIMYHGQGSATNLVAYSTDADLREWKKFEGNPVLRSPEKGDPMYEKYRAWDPEGWYDKETDHYYQISGGKIAGFFRSKDMMEWEYLGDLIPQDDRKRLDFEDLSCPDFFNIGDKQMLLFISHNLGTQYYIGTFKNGQYTIEQHHRMNWPGGTFFAPEQMVDDSGRNLIWGWVLERKPDHLEDFGWSGIMSMPRALSLPSDGVLRIQPPEEFKQLRLAGTEETDLVLSPDTEHLMDLDGTALEIEVELDGTIKDTYGVKVFCSPDGREETIIRYDPGSKELVIDFSNSSISAKGSQTFRSNCMGEPQLEGFTEPVSEQRAPFELKKGESLKLNIFIDQSIIEVFANGRQCMTQVVYPELRESNQVKLFTGSKSIKISHARVWQMARTNVY